MKAHRNNGKVLRGCAVAGQGARDAVAEGAFCA